jgi:hypothetical protein
MSRPFPLIEYAQKIGKNTADFTVKDMINFTKEWVRQEIREDLVKMTPEQREEYNRDIVNMKQWRGEQGMSKNSQKMKDAATSRLSVNLNDQELIDDGMAIEAQEESEQENEVVCEIGLTKTDIEALLWALHEIFENYDLTGTVHDLALKGLQEALEGV